MVGDAISLKNALGRITLDLKVRRELLVAISHIFHLGAVTPFIV